MKKLILSLFFTSAFIALKAQDTINYRVGPRKFSPVTQLNIIDTTEVIYDKEGKGYHFYQYSKMLRAGTYKIVRTRDKKRLLIKTEGFDNLAQYERIKGASAILSHKLRENATLDLRPLSKAINPKDLENKAIVMLFWSSECGSCIDNFAALNKILEPSVTNKDLVVMAVTPDMNQEAMKILKKHPFPYADHINQGGGIISGYMPAGQYPAYIIADKNHKIRFSSKGTDPAILSGFKVALQEVISN